MRIYRQIITLLIVLAAISCKKKEEPEDCIPKEFDRQEMVSQLTTQYIVPAYEDYFDKVDKMQDAIDIFIQAPTLENLKESRLTWQNAIAAWQAVSFLEFGPAENIALRSQANIYPVDTAKINSNIINGGANIALPENFAAKGFQSLDYLLFTPNKTDEEIIAFNTDHTNAIIYLKSINSELRAHAITMKDDWKDYSEDFINNTTDNAQGSAVSNIVNSLSAHYETFVRKGKVGLPVGIFNGFSQTPMPGHAEALYSGYSFDLLLAEMASIQSFITGKGFVTHTEGLGLDDYMDFVSAKKEDETLAKAINSQIDAIIYEIENINTEPLSEAVINQPAACKTLYQQMQKLVPMLKVDLTSALGVLITYQDNDGD